MLSPSSRRSLVAAVRRTASSPPPSSSTAARSLSICTPSPLGNGDASKSPSCTQPPAISRFFVSPTTAALERRRNLLPFVLSRRNEATAAANETTNQGLDSPVQKFEYQAEVSRLLDLIVHSLYSHKEVFLRELISNASDALDKFRFLSVTDPSLLNSGAEMQIRLECEPENGVLHITDTGIGMTKEDLIESLGTIAQSGTAKFLKAIKDNKDGMAGDSNLIGQFGVGFYSAFLVADKVAVSTKSPKSDKQYVWEGEAESNSYIVHEETDPERVLQRGTCITLFLKKDAKEYSDPTKISNLVKNYSQFISFPIYLLQEKTREIEVDDTDPKGPEAGQKTDAKEEKRVERKKKKVNEKYYEWELVNNTKPIWMRNPKEVTKEEYIDFCKKTFNQVLEPMAYSHFITEGEVEFRALLYIPGMAPISSEETSGSKLKNIRLYAKRVFISDAFDGDLFPRYLSFVKGVVDSSDIPLNVSREMLQESRTVNLIRKRLMKKTFEMIEDIERRDKEDYKKFWKNYSKYIKSGCIDDANSRKYLLPLLRFHTSKHEDEMVGLKTYLENMKKDQRAIYYFAADTIKSAKSAPFLERLFERDLEVLYLIESIDELLVTNLKTYEGKKFVDISKEDFDLGGKDKSKDDDVQNQYRPLCDWIKNQLGEKIAKVQISKRLSTSPCVLVSPKFGWSANMERIMKAQIGNTLDSAIDFARGSRILEINPRHPIIHKLNDVCLGKASDSSSKDMVELLYETALLASGFTLDDPPTYGSKVFEMMTLASRGPYSAIPGEEEAEIVGEFQASRSSQSVSEAEVINESIVGK